MRLKSIELAGFKSFTKKTALQFDASVTAIVGPNGSGKSNIAESFRFVLGEQSMKSMRGKRGEDMIWNGSANTPRAGRASVRVIFDNGDRALNLDFDEVAIERVVHRDGGNDYLLNGSNVRLRDIAELLAQANIGSSGHHIISQGEADRIISASMRERREMVEDALGLTTFLYKREEAEKKLEKTAENMREVNSLRRELAPHLRFLQSQVKKIEEAKILRAELAEIYLQYLKRESVYIRVSKGMLAAEREVPDVQHQELAAHIIELRKEIENTARPSDSSQALIALESESRQLASRRETLTRELGRVEGELAARERIVATIGATVPHAQAEEFAEHIQQELEEILNLDFDTVRARIAALIIFSKEFLRRIVQTNASAQENAEQLRAHKIEIEKELTDISAKNEEVARRVAELRTRIENDKDASREAERELFKAMARRSELEAVLAQLRAKEENLARDEESFRRELGEAGALIGTDALAYEEYEVMARGELQSDADIADEPRTKQEDRHRALERTKIRLEQTGAAGASEVLKEFTETSERDQFLMRELADLESSKEKLHALIDELTKTLETRFTDGIEKINTEFDSFFKLMFGGGSALLSLVKEKKFRKASDDDDLEVEEGIDIAISLPHKRIKGLHMLSGGERALTSIALIFAMSQVNPPPFLILDETDAALDEANSRRYSDMIENLSRKSQLILITHNRETMSRAGILYGITMGADGASKLLSVKFEEAVAVAK
jgi:chromosome segregation ATPase